jgi:hypothetical protein
LGFLAFLLVRKPHFFMCGFFGCIWGGVQPPPPPTLTSLGVYMRYNESERVLYSQFICLCCCLFVIFTKIKECCTHMYLFMQLSVCDIYKK